MYTRETVLTMNLSHIWIFLNLQPVIDTKIELWGKIKIQTENYLPTVHVYALAIHVAQNKVITEDITWIDVGAEFKKKELSISKYIMHSFI